MQRMDNTMNINEKYGFTIDTPHNEKYEAVVNDLGFEDVLKCVPFDTDTLVKAYQKNHAFNTKFTTLGRWDKAAGFVETGGRIRNFPSNLKDMLREKGVTCFSPSDLVCILKCAARMAVENELEKEQNSTQLEQEETER